MTDNVRGSWIGEPQISYEKDVLGGKMEALLGSTFQESNDEIMSQTASNFSGDALIENVSAAADHVINEYTKPGTDMLPYILG